MLGALLEFTKIVSVDSLVRSFKGVFPQERYSLIPLNEKALEEGKRLAKLAQAEMGSED